MIRLVVHGAQGRMGRRVSALASADDRFEIVAALDRLDASDEPTPDDRNRTIDADAVIDFSSDQGARRAVEIAVQAGAALLVGTTALSGETLGAVGDSARSIPVLVAANTARGVAVAAHLAAEAARLLGPDFDVDLVEHHHRDKRDAPSGTALRWRDGIERAGRRVPDDRVLSLRTGGIVGEHEAHFASGRERIRIVHAALDRDLFAAGALEAAAWLVGQPPGRYTIEQAFGM